MGRSAVRTQAVGPAAVRYDGDHRLLAFAGAVSLVIGSVFWALAGVRFALEARGPGEGLAEVTMVFCLSVAVAGAFLTLVAWGFLTKMQRGEALAPGDLARLLVAGLVVGVILGFLIYAALHFKLEDPDFYHLASEPENIPPAIR
jgi:hypothetical protein